MSIQKILVPTDFSNNSKCGLRFAMQWASQQKSELIFVYVFHIIRLPQWTEEDFRQYTKAEASNYITQLNNFVKKVYQATKMEPGNYTCIALQGVSPDVIIMDYCRERGDIDYICIATRGAGKVNKLFGTHTGNLITKSSVPVLAVPKHYKRRPIRHILYAADFLRSQEEIKKIEAFASPLKASIKLLHLAYPDEIIPDKNTIAKNLSSKIKSKVQVIIAKTDLSHSLFKDLQSQIKSIKPSVVAMFTNQERNFIEKIIFPSRSEQLSFETNIPLLVFKK